MVFHRLNRESRLVKEVLRETVYTFLKHEYYTNLINKLSINNDKKI